MPIVYRLLTVLLLIGGYSHAQTTIPIETADFAVVLQTDKSNYLNMVYCGKKLPQSADYGGIADGYQFPSDNSGSYNNAYTPAGTWNLVEPAIQVTHPDGNPSLDLKYVSHQTTRPDANSTLTTVKLADPVYKLTVTLFYKTWPKLNVVEQWSEISNAEKGPVVLQKYASANLFFPNKSFYLTSFQGTYLKEMQPMEEKLQQGLRTIDTKLGTRAMLLGTPNFMVAFDKPAQENSGMVMLGQLAWSGNYKLDFEIDSYQTLRLIAGINPYASAYTLPTGKSFTTPSLIYSLSDQGTGLASRQLQRWARDYRVLDGNGSRLTLLNNWEATYFDFDEPKLSSLIADTKKLGVDMFLLDDGWFGNKYPRNSDNAALGDWQENKKKLPNGIGYLVKEATKAGVKFGIWIEPEMVSPKSELYEKHLDWVIRQPDRPEKYYRNQLVLDLSNPQVQDFVFGVVDGLFTKNPELAFIKWDCNAVIYNAYSAWLNKQKLPQSHLYVEYVRGLYKVLERIRAKYPKVPMMLCSGGGGRGDYELLKYFTEFWPSDDTEPVERIFQQWNYSYFFPAITTDCHVTDWGKQPIKFRVDVASMGKLGFDVVVSHLSPNDLAFCQQAIKNYNGFKDIVWHGDQYRLLSPHENSAMSVAYVSEDKAKAVMFTYFHDSRVVDTNTKRPIPLAGLDPAKQYQVTEINLYPGTKSTLEDSKTYSGAFLMNVGLNPDVSARRTSVVLQLTQVP
ncbi:alpha-galactosidase [Spirosoma oryzae]|uniref:Alpha-galactosidase n=1 Tax=Spirosoma oryzae TaxID=1469603 RepID=A0A2T0RP82_9BACT|nr:alpha-galactosidase [Spirosoma oryzae]PRY22947.1 alpha-galactosidase [Spirosoma oryzae]